MRGGKAAPALRPESRRTPPSPRAATPPPGALQRPQCAPCPLAGARAQAALQTVPVPSGESEGEMLSAWAPATHP